MTDRIPIFTELLRLAVENGASDIHVKTGKPAILRLEGSLETIEMDPVHINDILGFVEETCPRAFQERWMTENEVDYSLKLEEIGRFRVNAFSQRGTPSIVFRHVRDDPPNFKDLRLDESLFTRLCQFPDGIVFVCGPTGSGKSSTLAAMLNWINHNQSKHVITLEDPIEFTYRDAKSSFQQREIGIDTPSFKQGMTSVLRQDPDVILIGELRDRESFEIAMTAAETGHFVLGTLHSISAQQAVQRLFEYYPADQHHALQRKVASTLRATVAQRLVPNLDGSTRVPVIECMITDGLVRSAILEGRFERIPSLVEAGKDHGNRSFNQDLLQLVNAGEISKKTALSISPNPKALEMNIKGIFLSEGGLVDG
jgi:twitching motility protein PilT